MRPLDSGVIAPEEQAITHAAEQNVAIGQQTVLDALQSSPVQAVLDLPLPQLPEDLPPIEPPAFVLSRKISDDQQSLGGVPAGLPGLNGVPSGEDPPGVPHEVSALLGDVNAAAAPVVRAALDRADGVLSGGLGDAPSSIATAVNQAAAALPPLPADPVAALMQGVALPALPGVDVLMKPILDLLGSFGSGILGALDPTAILSQSSQVIEMAMQVGKGSMAAVDQVWQSQAARSAQATSQQANVEGQETSQRGIDISELTQRAAAVVQQGNAQLLGIASSFATQATALAPVILTPPAQATLIASATDHLGHAVGVVNATRGDLAGKTAELGGMVQQLVGPGPQEAAQALAQNVGQPILEQAQSTAADTATKAAGLDSAAPGTLNPATTPSSVHATPSPSTNHGAPSGLLGSPGRPGTPSTPSVPKPTGLPGTPAAPIRPVTGIPGTPFGAGTPGTTATGANSFMGGPAAAAGQRNDDDEHSRTVQPYLSPTGNDDLTGPLGESTPDVIGATHSDEIISSDYEQDQF
ncbi:hypothetical protein OHA40_27650 [Nocardia sp. NBC_00508]|uniref:hypothetical protein n=1 Tax=Nocardia sp. NBC_00508 TaxID=2975992 RepID=UPI002E7FB710|nr:hypothetical protein [Nocardia sp. NBC_00508]WUD65369.1 hypothetical protein OHA40_27650 [Nocardia sp. NBC_00508]